MTFKPPRGWVPAWVDKATLCRETCLSERTVDAWVLQGLLPPGRPRGGKTMWRWSEIDEWLDRGGPEEPEETALEKITRFHERGDEFDVSGTGAARHVRHRAKAEKMRACQAPGSP
jgi:predicted DNA-binding transcriptional regulator AlpA